MKFKTVLCLVTAAFASSAFAEEEKETYSVPVARMQGDINCTISKANKSFDCSAHVAGGSEQAITMESVKDKHGALLGFHGMNEAKENGSNYTMVLLADSKKELQGLTLIADNKSEKRKSFSANVFTSASSKIAAANITPLRILISENDNIRVNLTFVLYGKGDEKVFQTRSPDDVIDAVMGHLQPYLLTLTK